MRVRVFGILPRDASVRVPQLRAIRAGSLVAAVAAAAGPRRPTAANLRAHDKIVRQLAADASAILPARFNTLVRDEDELRTVLRAREASFRGMLARVRGRVQMTLRVVLQDNEQEPRELLPVVRSGPARSGAAYLREKAARERPREAEPFRAAVQRWVRDERIERRSNVVTLYHLIPAGAVPAYLRAAAQVAAGPGVSVIRTGGPFPPYAFVEPWS